ncbi:MAG: pyridoxamine 5'-phosphate oxidase [Tepidisphaeraceae bacterium]|jgi:pyridoxamine 5'-phosphate oxidase
MDHAESDKVRAMRTEYGKAELAESGLLEDPIAQFGRWFDEAVAAKIPEPNSMVLATADGSGAPSARMMLLKGFDDRGFVFYTNYQSRKGRELDANPRAAILFCWQALERQVRVEGAVGRVSREESEDYFHSRPRLAQIGAWVSKQSSPVGSRSELDKRANQMALKYAIGAVPLPDFWGGYRLAAEKIEFWQGRPSRLHDRLLYSKQSGGAWTIERLSP